MLTVAMKNVNLFFSIKLTYTNEQVAVVFGDNDIPFREHYTRPHTHNVCSECNNSVSNKVTSWYSTHAALKHCLIPNNVIHLINHMTRWTLN